MQIAFGERPMPKAIIDFVRIGIMIARNPPHLGELHGVFQSQIEIFARLEIAQRLLAQDGCIFLSINENELFVLKLLCDEIFGDDMLGDE